LKLLPTSNSLPQIGQFKPRAAFSRSAATKYRPHDYIFGLGRAMQIPPLPVDQHPTYPSHPSENFKKYQELHKICVPVCQRARIVENLIKNEPIG